MVKEKYFATFDFFATGLFSGFLCAFLSQEWKGFNVFWGIGITILILGNLRNARIEHENKEKLNSLLKSMEQ